MLLEATIAMFVLMGITWAGAIFASYQDKRVVHRNFSVVKLTAKKAA